MTVLGMTFVLCSSVLVGCGNSIPNLSKEDEQKVGEYAAMVMLKYDANHRSRLVDVYDPIFEEPEPEIEEIVEEEPIEEEVEEPKEETPVIDSLPEATDPVIVEPSITIENLLGLPTGVSLVYTGYSFSKSFPEDDSMDSYFMLDATEGKKFLVLHYQLINQSGDNQSIDLIRKHFSFKAIIPGTSTVASIFTSLDEDLSSYLGVIENGDADDVVLIFEEDENLDENLESLTLSVKDSENSGNYTLI